MEIVKKSLQSIESDVQGLNRWRYANQLRGLEEFVEAESFRHYIATQRLISLEESQAAFPASISLTEYDYVYGLFDLFGEVMRYATTHASNILTNSQAIDGRTILTDLHELSHSFETLPEIRGKTYKLKMETMRQSVKKVEKLQYKMVLQGKERPDGWIPDLDNEPDLPSRDDL
jgi:predicted translin family RNA/ssDNA-binding protein